jgi:transposase
VTAAERKSIKETKKFLNKQIRENDKARRALVDSDKTLKPIIQALDDEAGIALQGACSMVGIVPELGELNRGKISALVGVCPYNKDSGTQQGSRSIAGGRATARSILYMLTLYAIRRNEHIKSFYRRLVKSGKLRKVAIVACMRKYLIYLNTKIAKLKKELNLSSLFIPAQSTN